MFWDWSSWKYSQHLTADCCSFAQNERYQRFPCVVIFPLVIYLQGIYHLDLIPHQPPLAESPPRSYLRCWGNRISDMARRTREAAMERSIIAMATWDGSEGLLVVIRHGASSARRDRRPDHCVLGTVGRRRLGGQWNLERGRLSEPGSIVLEKAWKGWTAKN